MKKTKNQVKFDNNENDLREVLEDMGIMNLLNRLPNHAEQEKALTKILPELRKNLDVLVTSPGNKSNLGRTSARVGPYYFQLKKGLYLAATLATGVITLTVLGPATAAMATAGALAPQVIGALRGINDILVKLNPAEIAVYEAVAGVELGKRTKSLTEEGASLRELNEWYKSRGSKPPTKLEKILEILTNERRALRSKVGEDGETYYTVIG